MARRARRESRSDGKGSGKSGEMKRRPKWTGKFPSPSVAQKGRLAFKEAIKGDGSLLEEGRGDNGCNVSI